MLIADKLAVAAILMLVMIIGGRIVPSFTTNWLRRAGHGRMPASFDRFDMAAMGAAAGALAAWLAVTALPVIAPFAAALMVAAGVMQAIRLGRWAGERTFAEPLVTVLHVAFAFVPLGFLLIATGLAMEDAAWRSAGIHAWTTGAIGLMTLAVMTRATRGHTGKDLTAPASTVAIYGLSVVAALARISASLVPDAALALLGLAGGAWVAAFALFVAAYGPLLVKPRI